MDLPRFEYHPDPIATGSFKRSEEICECCNKARGYVYTSIIYAEEEVEFICPWCIADGSAARKFDGLFSDGYSLREAGISEEIISQVCERTPGYNSWQQEEWLSHCGDACEFHGDAPKSELRALTGEKLDHFLKKEMIKPDLWKKILEHYEEGENPAICKFKCRQCGEVVYTMDFT
ncbi:MAG: CbrC family protein [Gammaproteobacteria bacterium]